MCEGRKKGKEVLTGSFFFFFHLAYCEQIENERGELNERICMPFE